MNPNGMFFGNGFPRMPNMMMGNAGFRGGLGLMGGARVKTGLFKSVNWGGLFNNASKALGVVNQTIPLVKQAGPMVSNMKSMLKLASVFKDETDVKTPETKDKTRQNNESNNVIKNASNSPNFFL